VDAITELIPKINNMNDDMPVEQVTGLSHVGSAANYIEVQWNPISCFDFKNYTIKASEQPFPNDDFIEYNDNTDPVLASPSCSTLVLDGLDANTNYFIQIEAEDLNGNTSTSETHQTISGAARLSILKGKSYYEYVRLSWRAISQYNNSGFIVERKLSDEENYETLTTWETDTTMVGSTEDNIDYEFLDDDFEFGRIYDYRISSQPTGDPFVPSGDVVSVYTDSIMIITVTNVNNQSDSVRFGVNHFASDGYESSYDIVQGINDGDIDARFYEGYYSTSQRYLLQNIKGNIDLENDFKVWTLRIKSLLPNQPVTVHLKDVPFTQRDGKQIFGKIGSDYIDLQNEDIVFSPQNTNNVDIKIYFGNLTPLVEIDDFDAQTIQTGTSQTFTWDTEHSQLVESIDLYAQGSDDELVELVTGLDGDETSYSYTAVNDDFIIGARLLVRVNHTDGTSRDWLGNSSFDIVKDINPITFKEGWHTMSNPFANSLIFYHNFEHDAEGFKNVYGEYQEVSSFLFGNSYWVFSELDQVVDIDGDVPRYSYTSDLTEGWMQVPNPFYHTISKFDLNIVYNGETFSFAEAIQNELIYPNIFVFDLMYDAKDYIEVGESFFIYCRVPLAQIQYKPYTGNPVIDDEPKDWTYEIVAYKNYEDIEDMHYSEMIRFIACENFSDEFDMFTDIPIAPSKPMEQFVNFSIQKDEDYSPYINDNLFQESIALLADPADEIQEFVREFTLETSEPGEISFSTNEIEFPENQRVWLEIGDEIIDLTNNDNPIFVAEETEYTGTIHIKNELVSNEDNIQVAFKSFNNYPNPFNPETTFNFSLGKQSDVKLIIYNVKGQKVAELADETMTAGNKKVVWSGKNSNAKDVASGVYFARLSINNNHKLRKVMLLK
jgi:hypothetical protein